MKRAACNTRAQKDGRLDVLVHMTMRRLDVLVHMTMRKEPYITHETTLCYPLNVT
jgi:hypothetical protein